MILFRFTSEMKGNKCCKNHLLYFTSCQLCGGCNGNITAAVRTHNWIHEQDVSLVDIRWKLGVEHFRLVHSLVAHDEHLTNTHRTTAVSQSTLHRLTYTHQRSFLLITPTSDFITRMLLRRLLTLCCFHCYFMYLHAFFYLCNLLFTVILSRSSGCN